jgi:hypothetical protein
MANDGTGRRAAWDLFAERHVHLRSGGESRYVVLSRPLQIGVSAAALTILALLGVASYSAIAKHLALTAQERVLSEERALRAAQEQEAAQEATRLRLQSEAAERETLRLSAALDQAQAEREAAITASTEAGSKAAELQAALAATTESRLATERAETGAAGDARPSPPANAAREQELLAEITGLRAELERVNRETLALRRGATQARQALRDLQGGAIQALSQAEPGPAPGQADGAGTAGPAPRAAATPAADQVRRLQRSLADARASIATLSADLEALKGTGAGPASDAAVDLATLEEQLGAAQQRALQLGLDLAAPPTPDPGDTPPLPSPPAPR